jgi:hypothetical protein
MLNFKKNNFLATILTLLFIPCVYSQTEENEIPKATQEEKIAEVMSVLLANGYSSEEATDLVEKALKSDASQVLKDTMNDYFDSQKQICTDPSTIPEIIINPLNTGIGNCNMADSDLDGCNIVFGDIFGDVEIYRDGSWRFDVFSWTVIKLGIITHINCVQRANCSSPKTCKTVISSDADGQWMECNCR